MPKALFLPSVLLLLLLAANAGAQTPGPPAAAAPPSPSLLLVTMDTTRPDHLQPYGASGVETPALSALAAQGIVFDQAFAVAPLTLVAHASMFTGLFPPRTGVRNNGIHYVSSGMTTLAERLRDRGWRTAAFVSAAVLDHRYGLDQGFEVYDDTLSAGTGRLPRMVPDRPAAATVAAARAWLDALPPGQPWFLWVHLFDPHMAYAPPPPYSERYASAPYDGEIAYMDSEIGRLLAHPAVASHPDVVVIAMADHGESLGEHGEMSHGLLAYDSTLHIPLIVRMPGATPGQRVEEQASQVDLVPTVLDVLHLPPDPSLPGRSLAFLLASPGTKRSLYAESYAAYYGYGWAKLHVLRRGRWKLIDGPDPELYDTARDPKEQTNLVARRRRIASNMKSGLGRALASMSPVEREESLPVDAESAERLRSLGYVATGSAANRSGGERPDPKAVIGLHVEIERARRFLDDRDYASAEARFRALLEKDPTNLGALIDLAIALEDEGRPDEALWDPLESTCRHASLSIL